MFKQQ